MSIAAVSGMLAITLETVMMITSQTALLGVRLPAICVVTLYYNDE